MMDYMIGSALWRKDVPEIIKAFPNTDVPCIILRRSATGLDNNALTPKQKPIGGSKITYSCEHLLLHIMKGRVVGIRSPVAGLYISFMQYLRLD
jgi:hypothetical protein